MATEAPVPGMASTTASRYELPGWYTQLGQNLAGNALNLTTPNIGGYQGYSTNGVWNPTVAGMSPNEQLAGTIAAGGNLGGWQQYLNTGMDTMNGGLGQVAAAGGNYDAAGGYLNDAGGSFGAATGTINSATGNFNQASDFVNSASNNFNNAEGMYGVANGSYGGAATGYGNAADVLNSGRGILSEAYPSFGQSGGAFDWAMGNLNPARSYTANGGTSLAGNGANQAALDSYMNPYRTQVADEIARLGNQNLFEDVIPNINTTFVGTGQFGSSRNGDFMNRAVRDNQATISGQQGQVLLAAVNEAEKNYGLEKDRQLQAGQTLGGLSQVGGLIGQGLTGLGTGYVNATNANTSIGTALNNNSQGLTDLGRAQTDTGLAWGTTGRDRVNQGLAQDTIGNSVVNQGQALTNVGIGQVGQANASTSIGNGRVNQGQTTGSIGYQQGQLGSVANAGGVNDINALLGTGGIDRGINQAQLDSDLKLWQDWRDHPINSLGALSQIMPQISGRITPDSVSSTGYAAGQPDPYRNIQEIIAAINGRS